MLIMIKLLIIALILPRLSIAEFNQTNIHINDSQWFDFNEREERCSSGKCFGGYAGAAFEACGSIDFDDMLTKFKTQQLLGSGTHLLDCERKYLKKWMKQRAIAEMERRKIAVSGYEHRPRPNKEPAVKFVLPLEPIHPNYETRRNFRSDSNTASTNVFDSTYACSKSPNISRTLIDKKIFPHPCEHENSHLGDAMNRTLQTKARISADFHGFAWSSDAAPLYLKSLNIPTVTTASFEYGNAGDGIKPKESNVRKSLSVNMTEVIAKMDRGGLANPGTMFELYAEELNTTDGTGPNSRGFNASRDLIVNLLQLEDVNYNTIIPMTKRVSSAVDVTSHDKKTDGTHLPTKESEMNTTEMTTSTTESASESLSKTNELPINATVTAMNTTELLMNITALTNESSRNVNQSTELVRNANESTTKSLTNTAELIVSTTESRTESARNVNGPISELPRNSFESTSENLMDTTKTAIGDAASLGTFKPRSRSYFYFKPRNSINYTSKFFINATKTAIGNAVKFETFKPLSRSYFYFKPTLNTMATAESDIGCNKTFASMTVEISSSPEPSSNAAENATSVTVSATSVAENATTVAENVTSVTVNTSSANGNTTTITENDTSVTENVTSVTKNVATVTENALSVTVNATFDTENAIFDTENATTVAENATTIAENVTSVTEKVTSVTKNATSVTENTLSVTVNATSVNENATSVTENATVADGTVPSSTLDNVGVKMEDNEIFKHELEQWEPWWIFGDRTFGYETISSTGANISTTSLIENVTSVYENVTSVYENATFVTENINATTADEIVPTEFKDNEIKRELVRWKPWWPSGHETIPANAIVSEVVSSTTVDNVSSNENDSHTTERVVLNDSQTIHDNEFKHELWQWKPPAWIFEDDGNGITRKLEPIRGRGGLGQNAQNSTLHTEGSVLGSTRETPLKTDMSLTTLSHSAASDFKKWFAITPPEKVAIEKVAISPSTATDHLIRVNLSQAVVAQDFFPLAVNEISEVHSEAKAKSVVESLEGNGTQSIGNATFQP